MEALKEYPAGFATTLELSFDFLFRSNIRFLNNHETFVQKHWRFLYIIPIVMLLYVTFAIYICNMLSNEQIFLIAYSLPLFLVCTQAVLKIIVLVPRTSEVTGIIEELGNLWRVMYITEEQEKERTELLKKLRFFSSVLYWVSVIGTGQYLSSPLLETLIRRLVLNEDCELIPCISCSFPLGPTDNWYIYIGIYMLQVYSIYLSVFAYIGTELLMIALCALMGVEFKLLRDDLLRLKPITNKNTVVGNTYEESNSEYTIKDLVKKHQKLIELSRRLDKAFNPVVFIDLFFVGITTCFFKYAGQFSRGPSYMICNYVAMISSLQQVLLLCYYGELLTGASAEVGDAAYHNLWYKGDRQYQKTIWFIIKRCQKPCSLTSMRYTHVNLNMFTKVMSSTWSYISLMNSVYGEKEE